MERFLWLEKATSGAVAHGTTSVAEDGIQVTVLGDSHALAQAQALLADYLRSGGRAADMSMPAVGYVVEDARRARTMVFASPVALKQIYWSTSGSVLQLASEPAAMASPAHGTHSMAPDALFRYVYFHHLPGPLSVLAHAAKLAAGHLLEWDGRMTRVSRYWKPSFAPDRALTLDAASAELHRLLAGAVDHSLQQGRRCGTFLSGGLDSSTVAGFAAKSRPGIATVSMGFDAQGYDEMEFARTASRCFGTRPLEYYITPEDVIRTLPDIAAAFSEPFGNASAAAAFHCARIAREEGIDTLLAGDGGDELFGGNERYATQMVFERYWKVPRLLRAVLEPAVGAAARVTTMFPFGKAQRYVSQARTPLPDRLQDYNFLHRIAPEEVFDPALLSQVDREAPLRLLREEFNAPADADLIDRMLFLDWRFTLHDNDLVKVNTMCELAGVKVEYPMLHPSLIGFSMRLPSDWKVRNGQLRWFYKRAMRGFLPDRIIDKSKHGFGLPFGVWTRTHPGLQRMATDALESLAKRSYFRREFIANAQRLHREGHAAYYGELVWILMVLELWLQRHMPRAGL